MYDSVVKLFRLGVVMKDRLNRHSFSDFRTTLNLSEMGESLRESKCFCKFL